MAYLALYRKYRPRVFEDLIGQETVVRALVNQIKTDKIGHAYLFCGARGTGKTTAAKIFARAINCEKKNGSPCGECETCKKLNSSDSLDIVEMDAASNNKVENVREIREKVQYPPVSGRYKVYIIDEVHMLTTEAFNALLKTLEEPPKHAVFILATTEPHKLPATILSRCMRFDFKLIPVQKIAKLISEIFDDVGKEYDAEAVTAIARAGEGSVRDALSIADICLSYNDKKLTYNDVIDVLGASDRGKTAKLVKCIFAADAGGALAVCDELSGLGKNIGMMLKDVLSFLRDVMVTKTCKSPEEILALPKEDIEELRAIADMTDNGGLLRTVEIFSQIENDIKYSTHPRVIFETAIVKATTKSSDYNIDALLSRISKLENQLQNGDFAKSVNETTAIKSTAQVDANAIESRLQDRFDEKFDEKTKSLAKRLDVLENEMNSLKNQASKIAQAPKAESYAPKTENYASKTESNAQKTESVKAQKEDLTFGFKAAENAPKKTESVAKTESVSGQEAVPTAPQSVETAQNAQNSESGGEFKSSVPDRRIWGTFLKSLREGGNSILWVVCQELDAKVTCGKLTIFVNNEREQMAVTKKENFEKIKSTLATICNYNVEIVRKGEEVDTFENDVEKMKVDFAKLDIED